MSDDGKLKAFSSVRDQMRDDTVSVVSGWLFVRLLARTPLRIQLLLVMNGTMVVALLALLVLDYRIEWARHLRDERNALTTEARSVLVAVENLWHHGPDTVQQYINSVCHQPTSVIGHQITVVHNERIFQDHSPNSSSRELGVIEAAAHAPDEQVATNEAGSNGVLVSDARSGNTIVYVGESAGPMMRVLQRQLLWRGLSLLAVGAALNLVMNLILVRLVTRPLENLVSIVRKIEAEVSGKNPEGVLAKTTSPTRFGCRELTFLANEIIDMGRSLKVASSERHWQMNKARRVQQNLLPSTALSDSLTLAWRSEPAEDVGGDYVDVRPAGPGRFVLCLADVAGHGVAAAMGAAMLKVLFTAALGRSSDPSAILTDLDKGFEDVVLDEDFATVIIVLIDVPKQKLSYASAGHEPCYLLRHDTTENVVKLESTGPLLGIGLLGPWETLEVTTKSRDRLVLLTDGWSEALASNGQMFGRDRLLAALQSSLVDPIDAATGNLVKSVAAWRCPAAQADDMTLLAIDWP